MIDPRGNRHHFDDSPEWRSKVVQAYRTGGSVDSAAVILGIGRRTLQRWISESPKLQRELDAARRKG